MLEEIKIAEYYSSKGTKPDKILKGTWEQERPEIHDVDKPDKVRVWVNKEVKKEEYHD